MFELSVESWKRVTKWSELGFRGSIVTPRRARYTLYVCTYVGIGMHRFLEQEAPQCEF
jgi:hypothetical protein